MRLDDDDNTLLHISWVNINSGATAMSEYMSCLELPDVIITRQEDVIAGALVSNAIEVPLCIAHIDSKQQNGTILDCMPKVDRSIRSGVYYQAPIPTIAIISTFIDNNKNVNDLVSYYKNRGHKVKTLCLYSRKEVETPADYTWVKITRHAKYLFPWQEK